MGTWINPETEVRKLCEAVDDGNVTIDKLRTMYDKHRDGKETDNEYSDIIDSLVENQLHNATISSVTRYVVHKKCEGQFPWENENLNEQYDADELVDKNISEADIRETFDNFGDIGSVVTKLLEELPDDMSEDTRNEAKNVLSGKCGRVLDL